MVSDTLIRMKVPPWITFLLVLGMPWHAGASEAPSRGECNAQIHVNKILVTDRHNTPDRIAFAVISTDCDFIAQGKVYESSSIDVRDRLKANVREGAVIDGEVARGSTMGPNGIVRWFAFSAPEFSNEALGFTSGY